MERKTKILLVSTVLMVVVLSGVAAMVYANKASNGTEMLMTYADGLPAELGNATDLPFMPGGCGGEGRPFHGGRGHDFSRTITVSDEYKDNVINITESDSDVQELLIAGYNITGVKPIISTTIEADGTVTMKASKAIVTMCQNSTGRAIVWVDVDQAKVTRIEILSLTIIDKS